MNSLILSRLTRLAGVRILFDQGTPVPLKVA